MTIPPRKIADQYLVEAGCQNPGRWVAHSQQVAQAAEALATHHPQLSGEPAYILGLLHDIGRRVGVTDMRHGLDGYHFLIAEGYPEAAQICLTHSFPLPFTGVGSGKWDCSAEELTFVQSYLDRVEYTQYDRLIQLCDAICLPAGPVLMEKRLMDVTLRHGFNDFTLRKWQAFFTIQSEFETELGASIYQFLPNVAANTFEVNL
jgi:hypothetical protein